MNNRISLLTLITLLSTIAIFNNYTSKVNSEEILSINTDQKTWVNDERVTTINHVWKGENAVTLRVKNIPILTFIGENSHQEAEEVIKKINQLQPESYQEMKVVWDKDSQNYSVKIDSLVIVELNKNCFLSDTTNNSKEDAAQVSKRLRRLLGNIYDVVEEPEPTTKINKKTVIVPKTNKKTVIVPNTGKKTPTVKMTKRGIASWYGPGFHGELTANGERYNSNDYTAAHKTFPFGTKVRVTNLSNGHSVIVRINDRGPFIRGREIDLSAQAARVLNIDGLAQVKIEVISF